MKKPDFTIREKVSRSGRPITVVDVRSDRPIPPAKDSGYVKTIVIRKAGMEPAAASE